MASIRACKVSLIRWQAVTEISTAKTVLLAMRFSIVVKLKPRSIRPV